MRMTLSIPDRVAIKFQAAIPPRKRSRLVTSLLEKLLEKRENALSLACRAANKDSLLEKEIEEWQSFDDGLQE